MTSWRPPGRQAWNGSSATTSSGRRTTWRAPPGRASSTPAWTPITFAWAGPGEPGLGHYYAVRGPEFLIEYDNTQNDANHIHAVWRDLVTDWGGDALTAHYRAAHQGAAEC